MINKLIIRFLILIFRYDFLIYILLFSKENI